MPDTTGMPDESPKPETVEAMRAGMYMWGDPPECRLTPRGAAAVADRLVTDERQKWQDWIKSVEDEHLYGFGRPPHVEDPSS